MNDHDSTSDNSDTADNLDRTQTILRWPVEVARKTWNLVTDVPTSRENPRCLWDLEKEA